MNIAFIIPNLKKGGAERIVLDICNEINNSTNHKLVLITFSDKTEYENVFDNINWVVIPSKYTPSILKNSHVDLEQLQQFINEYQPDIIHSHLWESEIILTQIDIGNAVRFTHFHDNMVQLKKLKFSYSKRDITNYYEKILVEKNYNQNKNYFICISKDTYSFAKNVLPKINHNSIHLLINAIDLSRFKNNRTREGVKNKIKLINIGSFVKKKNQMFIVDIAKELNDYNIDFEITLLGDGPLIEDVKAYAEKLNLHQRIIFKGNVEKVEDFLRESDIYIHSANYEPLGLVILEAMAAGLPTITLDGKGNRDLIEEGKNGFMIYDEDPKQFVQKILYLSEDSTQYSEISRFCEQFANKYDIKQYTTKLLELYRHSISSANLE